MSLKFGSHLTLYLSANYRPGGYIIQFSEDFSSTFCGESWEFRGKIDHLSHQEGQGEILVV